MFARGFGGRYIFDAIIPAREWYVRSTLPVSIHLSMDEHARFPPSLTFTVPHFIHLDIASMTSVLLILGRLSRLHYLYSVTSIKLTCQCGIHVHVSTPNSSPMVPGTNEKK